MHHWLMGDIHCYK